MLHLTRAHLALAASRALTGHGQPPVVIVEGLGVLDHDTISRTIAAIGPALLSHDGAGDRRRAVALAAAALRPLPAHPDPATDTMRELEARAFVTWFVGLAAEAACIDTLCGVVTVLAETSGEAVDLTAVGLPHTATLRAAAVDRDWVIETFTADALVSRAELHGLSFAAAVQLARAGLHTLASQEPGSGTTACTECGLPIDDDDPSVIDPSHARSCSLHPWAITVC